MKFSKSNKNGFFMGLQPLVEEFFLSNAVKKTGNWKLAFKGVILICIYLLSYISIFRDHASFPDMIICYIIMGVSGVMIVFNIVHDASHHAISSKRWINKYLCYVGDFVGINTYIWNIRHNIQHHTFTNILGGDLIIENVPLIRLSPQQPYKSFHRYQLIYTPFLYLFYSLYWIFIIDFKLFFRKDICNLHDIKHPTKEWTILIISKLFYVFYTIALPYALTSLSLSAAVGFFLIMHMAAGLLLSFVAVLGHFVEGTSFPEPQNEIIESSWIEHELAATIDFAPGSKLINWITGGLNTHVVHHLYPSICHVHYFRLTSIIEQYCNINQFEYKKDSLWGALKSHFRYLKKLSLP